MVFHCKGTGCCCLQQDKQDTRRQVLPADRQLYQLGGSCNSGKHSRQRATARQFQNGLLMNIRPQRFSAAPVSRTSRYTA